MTGDIVLITFVDFARRRGLRRKAKTAWQTQDETVLVINLQKSDYSPAYYINVGISILSLSIDKSPKLSQCHLQGRLESLLARSTQLARALDLESQMAEAQRRETVSDSLNEGYEVLRRFATVDAIRTERQSALEDFLVLGTALDALDPDRR